MSQSTLAEEFDPITGSFRPIKGAITASARKPVKQTAPDPRPAKITGLSENGQRYGVFFEAFEHAAKSPMGNMLYRGAQAVIVVAFLLLMYEALNYRLALG
ncbi:MAG: hypothetical protein AAGI34_00095 [Pseudomonadota bacterium]